MRESDNISNRAREFINLHQKSYKFFEEVTGIRQSRWRDLQHGKAKYLQSDMLEALCNTWPEYAYWFVTGKAKAEQGQSKPFQELGARSFTPQYGRVSVLRHASGNLIGGLGSAGHLVQGGEESEIEFVQDLMFESGLVSKSLAEKIAPKFWEKFIKKLENGAEMDEMTMKQFKHWINKNGQWGESD